MDYLLGWMAVSELAFGGRSWSGHERNCAYLNLGDGTFANVSSSSGIDFEDDARSLAVTDWDGDGDLDFWMRNRSGPQVRFMKNDGDKSGHYVQFRLTGTKCNRDAIGARVEVHAGGRRLFRTLMAGDGYLAQSSKWLHFGLGETDKIDRVLVRWPNGATQEHSGPPVDGRYRIVEGKDDLARTPDRNVRIKCAPAPDQKPPSLARLLLTEPLPLPPSLTGLSQRPAGRVQMIMLWAHWCAPCKVELRHFAEVAGEFASVGVDIVALNLDEPAEQAAAREFFKTELGDAGGDLLLRIADDRLSETLQAVLRHVRHNPTSTPLPASFLVDPQGQLQMVYVGQVDPEQLLADIKTFCVTPVPSYARMITPGRWYARHPRNLPVLAMSLRSRGCDEDARFYEELVGELHSSR